MVVGLGPGDTDLLTPRALASIREADLIIGYKTYVDLIQDLISDKSVISSGMRKEIDRARLAVDEACAGKNVAVVSSGDPGVYGMAGIVLEVARNKVPVEIIPGVTAATSSASVLGAPLMHDFAVISLSDLLTPWDTISQRLRAAAAGDFIMVLYNPRSKGRPENINQAREILLPLLNPQTPVGIVRCAQRGEQSSVITTLQDMLDSEIDMLTTVIIGNTQTRVEAGKMITPRGYQL
ncbi:MAG TPA: precorrin-3B C(17)-methyltransferase [Syntrophomonas sp.]|jgi:precorrin-3B C17-methyltransferase|nr:precorrin-3B C(17)-methyltransferase [Syntrophomonas sp.]